MKTHGLVIALAVVLAAWPVVSQEEDPAERQMRLVEEEESPIIKDVPVEPPGSKRILVTARFSDTDIRKAIATIAKTAGLNIRVDPKVKGKVSLTLKDMPWRDALSAVTKIAKAVVVTEKDGTLRIVPFVNASFFKSGLTYRFADGKVTLLPPDKILKVNGPLSYRADIGFGFTPVKDDPISKNLRAAVKSLRAAGLEKEARAAEKELARRENMRKRITVVTDPKLTGTIQALRADVAALRKEVRELTALVQELAEKKGK